MKTGISILSIIPMRSMPQEQSEMVSQLLFGECYQVIGETTGWIEISTLFDHYHGWIDRKLFVGISESFYNALSAQLPPVLDALLMNIGLPGAQPLTIVAGSSLPGYHLKKDRITIEDMDFQIHWTFGKTNARRRKTFPEIVGMFLNSPYLWGGRTPFGCDCSGFVQTAFKMTGVALRRDASQQAEQGIAVDLLSEARMGDLAFFANAQGKVVHVGLILSPDEIVHCSGFVRKDKLDTTGILNPEKRQYTHRLSAIRRII